MRNANSQLDGTARLWDTVSGRQLAVLSKDRVEQIVLAPDSARVLVVSDDGTARIFPVFPSTRAAMAHGLEKVPRQLTAADRKRYYLEAE